MLVTWTDRLLWLLVTLSCLTSLPAQEGERGGPEAPAADISAMHYLGRAADPAAIMLPIVRPYRDQAFASLPQTDDRVLIPGQFSTDGRIYPLGQLATPDGAETILARVSGPGMITRIWLERPMGQLRVRIDGADEPVLNMEVEAIVKGFIALYSPPLLGRTGAGAELLRPIPFGSEVLVTCDQPLGHYLVEVQTYALGLSVDNFDTSAAIGESFPLTGVMTEIVAAAAPMPELQVELNRALMLPRADAAVRLKGGATATILERKTETAGQLDWLELETLSPFAEADLPAELVLIAEVDGEETMRLPLAHLFGASEFVAAASVHQKASEVIPDRVRRRRFSLPQPFAESLTLRVANLGKTESRELRFRFAVSEAEARLANRRLTAKVLTAAEPKTTCSGDFVVAAESLLAQSSAAELRQTTLIFGAEGEFELPLSSRLGLANSGSWSNTFSAGAWQKQGVTAFRSRLFERLQFSATDRLRLVNAPEQLSYVLFCYRDATKGD